MNSETILNMSDGLKEAAIYYGIHVIVMIFIIIGAILFIIKKKQLRNKINPKILAPILIILVLSGICINTSIDVIRMSIISMNLAKDSREMETEQTNGYLEDIYAQVKLLFIVVNSNSYIYDEYMLNKNINIGEEYHITYLKNSKLISEIY